MWHINHARQHQANQSAVVVSFCSLNSCLYDHITVLDRIVTVNGQPVHGVHDVARILGGASNAGNKPPPKRRRRQVAQNDSSVITLGLAVDGTVSVTRDQLKAESEMPKTSQQPCVLAL